ncbi:MAG: glycosyltransferase, partial [Patescibacteria group bacterium]|nr:glycosyltransferase [Patescibacteria group bacterium]
WSLGVPAVVHTVHGAPFHPYESWPARAAIRACEWWAARRCHAMISVADRMTELMVGGNVAPCGKFTTIYSGMEVEPFLESDQRRQHARHELGYAPEHVVIAKVARLFHLKGHEYLVRAAEQVVRTVPNARFLLVGDGILKDRIHDQIDAAGLTAHFQFTGLVPPQRIPDLLAASDLVVHASLREGLARVLPQALISGKPVISFDVDGAREVVLPNETGFLVPPRNATALAVAIARLAVAPELRHRLGQEGRRRFSDVFRHEHMTAQIRQLYLRLLGEEPT